MKRVVLLAALFAVAIALAARQTNVSEDEGRVLALEKAWNLAIEQKDTKALDMLLDNSMVSVDIDGSTQNKAEFLAGIKAPDYQPSQAVTEQTSVHVYGNTAVVIGIFRIKGTEKGKTFVHRERFVDTWIKTDNSWQCVATTSTLISAKPAD
jgi:ketosteroid isomerase-like protein